MSKILSYNNKTTKTSSEDWIPVEPYTDDDIRQIKDPNGGLSRNPRTAIPSPFAQLDLVKNAFEHLQPTPQGMTGIASEQIMVSNALDVAQLFFEYENHSHQLHIVRWNKATELERLKASPEHRLYGETLELFLQADRVYNFNQLQDWYILLLNNQVIGATSPCSFTMAAPNVPAIDAVNVEPNVKLFSQVRDLWQRDDEFVYHLFLLFNAHTSLRRSLGNVYQYMVNNLPLIQRHKPALYDRIIAVIPNPTALQADREPMVRQMLDMQFSPFAGENAVSVLSAPLYRKKMVDVTTSAATSDFVIAPTREQAEGELLPLVLRNNFNGSVDHYIYINREWDSATEVYANGVPLEERHLPDTSIHYPFLTTADFFTENIIRLGGTIDENHYFDGNIVRANTASGTASYLLPLKPVFFKYFNAADLTGHVMGRQWIDIVETGAGSVTVTLRIPVKKRFIELSRTYIPIDDASWQFSERMGMGRIISGVQLCTSIFPFVRTNRADAYKVQLFTYVPGGGGTLRFLADGGVAPKTTEQPRTRLSYATTYYDVQGNFDYIEASVSNELGTFEGVIVPQWKPYAPSAKELIFAVDFGTTNSHVEWAERDQESQPLTFTDQREQALIASLLKKDSLLIADQLQRIEFLPREIDDVYGFPLRTALANNRGTAGGTNLFSDINIPFLYERQYFDGYEVATNLKWMGDNTLSKEFLREIVLLIRAKALLENADLEKVRLVYFYPVSMGGADRSRLATAWEDLYRTYLGGNIDSNLHAYPESIAPAFYYKGADVAGSSYVSVDIGGGTSDTVIYQTSPDQQKTVPVAISSFRFAGNAIFGDAFTAHDSDANPLLQHYTEYFRKLVTQTPDVTYLNSIMSTIMAGKRSEDINAFLFSIENVEQLRNLPPMDRNRYSYNALLRGDDQRKLVFVYFYSALIYYIAASMKHRGFVKPKQVYFSGTGSKILNIVGNRELVTEITQSIIERVFGEKYTEPFTIKVERDCPKQITCRGGIRLENERLQSHTTPEMSALIDMMRPRGVNALKYCYSMIDEEQLTIEQVNDIAVRDKIADEVKRFNQFFIDLCDPVMRDELGVDTAVFNTFKAVVDDNVTNYLIAGINSYLQGRYEPGAVVEDVPFFYPVIGVIRYNLLNNL
ncbi:MAG: hypothetical protein Q4B68_07800 [Bacteroidales bacterium]|nr:hypothetical protein [Bacteroidales bacterium]